MPGIQSSSIPEPRSNQSWNHHSDQPSNRHPAPYPEQLGASQDSNRALEAARRYLERQQRNEAALTAMEREDVRDEARSAFLHENDGRPAWLRRWPAEVRREIATERYVANRAETLPQKQKEDAPLVHESEPAERAQSSHAAVLSGTYTNGYTGCSVEAGFDFETPYHFETAVEAETTEDWLHLSSGHLDTGALRTGSSVVDSEGTAGQDTLQQEATGDRQRIGQLPMVANHAGQSPTEAFDPPPAFDPHAVRAAIFRLAQQMPIARQAVRGEAAEDALEATEQTAFAEVALKAWGGAHAGHGTVEDDELERESHGDPWQNDETNRLEFSHYETTGVRVELETDGPCSAVPLFADVETGPDQHGDLDGVSTASENAESHSIAKVADGLEDRDLTINPVENVTAPATIEADRLQETPIRHYEVEENIPEKQRPFQHVAPANGAPALAHDANNLLSALNLYSELLALAGVLQARHQHYAQDLKLLAARSEVLIGRLLAACRSGASEPQGEQGRTHDPLAGTTSVDLQTTAPQVEPVSTVPDELDIAPTIQQHGDTAVREVRLAAEGDAATGAGVTAPAPDDAEAYRHGAQPLHRPAMRNASEEAVASFAEAVTDEVPPLNLADLLTRWHRLLSVIGHGVVQVSLGPNATCPIRVAEESMERILVNLVHNAMTATQNGGAIRISVGRADTRRPSSSGTSAGDSFEQGKRMLLTVDDSGCGMTQEQIEKILGTNLQQLQLEQASGVAHPRRGLGLQIVRELLAASGGRLTIYSRRGAGTRIEMDWPIIEAAVAVDAPSPHVAIEAQASSIGQNPVPKKGSASEGRRPEGYGAGDSSRGAGFPATFERGARAC